MRSRADALYLVHAPDGRRHAFDRPAPALALALLLSVVHGAPVRLDVGRQPPPAAPVDSHGTPGRDRG